MTQSEVSASSLPKDAENMEWSAQQMQAAGQRVTEYIAQHLESLETRPILDLENAVDLSRSFREPLPDSGCELESLMPDLDIAFSKSFTTPGPGYLAFVPGGGIFPAALADYLSLALNRYVGMWNAAPVLVQMELTAIDWIRQAIRLPAGYGGILTSGGSISSLIAMITARRTRLPENFLKGVIYVSREVHHCVAKSALLAGFPADNVRQVEIDSQLRMRVDSLQQQIERDRQNSLTPFMVVTSAGTTNTGAIDPTEKIAEICQSENLWLHVDAAYGGFFRMVDDGEKRLPGLEMADSIVLDPHKGLFLPYGTGCLLVRDRDDLRRAHQLTADYLQDLNPPADGTVNFADISPELSRDFRGFRIWLPFKLYGIDAFRDNLREKLELAQWAFEELQDSPGFECFNRPELSIFAFRYLPKSGDVNEFNEKLGRKILEKGRVFLTSTRIDDQYFLRIAVLSFRTHAKHLVECIEDIRTSAAELESP